MRHQQLRNTTLLFIGTALLLASSPGMAQAPRRSAEELLEAMQGTWVRDSMNNKGDWIRREKVIQGHTETITDYDKDNQKMRGWTVQFKVERFAGKYNVFRTSGVVYIFDVDDNYWYELHDLKRTKTMLPAFRRVKPTGNLNENTLKGIENWIGKWRGDFVPTAVAGYGNVGGEPLQVDFTVEKNSLGTTLVFSWIESKKSSGEVVGTVHGYAAWSPAKKTHVIHYINSNGANVKGTLSPRGKVCVHHRGGTGAEGTFSEVCIMEFPDADTLVHKIINRVHNGQSGPDAVPVTLKRVQE